MPQGVNILPNVIPPRGSEAGPPEENFPDVAFKAISPEHAAALVEALDGLSQQELQHFYEDQNARGYNEGVISKALKDAGRPDLTPRRLGASGEFAAGIPEGFVGVKPTSLTGPGFVPQERTTSLPLIGDINPANLAGQAVGTVGAITALRGLKLPGATATTIKGVGVKEGSKLLAQKLATGQGGAAVLETMGRVIDNAILGKAPLDRNDLAIIAFNAAAGNVGDRILRRMNPLGESVTDLFKGYLASAKKKIGTSGEWILNKMGAEDLVKFGKELADEFEDEAEEKFLQSLTPAERLTRSATRAAKSLNELKAERGLKTSELMLPQQHSLTRQQRIELAGEFRGDAIAPSSPSSLQLPAKGSTEAPLPPVTRKDFDKTVGPQGRPTGFGQQGLVGVAPTGPTQGDIIPKPTARRHAAQVAEEGLATPGTPDTFGERRLSNAPSIADEIAGEITSAKQLASSRKYSKERLEGIAKERGVTREARRLADKDEVKEIRKKDYADAVWGWIESTKKGKSGKRVGLPTETRRRKFTQSGEQAGVKVTGSGVVGGPVTGKGPITEEFGRRVGPQKLGGGRTTLPKKATAKKATAKKTPAAKAAAALAAQEPPVVGEDPVINTFFGEMKRSEWERIKKALERRG